MWMQIRNCNGERGTSLSHLFSVVVRSYAQSSPRGAQKIQRAHLKPKCTQHKSTSARKKCGGCKTLPLITETHCIVSPIELQIFVAPVLSVDVQVVRKERPQPTLKQRVGSGGTSSEMTARASEEICRWVWTWRQTDSVSSKLIQQLVSSSPHLPWKSKLSIRSKKQVVKTVLNKREAQQMKSFNITQQQLKDSLKGPVLHQRMSHLPIEKCTRPQTKSSKQEHRWKNLLMCFDASSNPAIKSRDTSTKWSPPSHPTIT